MYLADATKGNKRNMLDDTGFEANRGASRDVEPMAVSCSAVEVECSVCLRQVDMATDLHRTISGIDDVHHETRQSWIDGDIAVAEDDLPRSHAIGWWTVTSFVPSGKVAST